MKKLLTCGLLLAALTVMVGCSKEEDKKTNAPVPGRPGTTQPTTAPSR